jgi:tetratricopeptide (TPR) repeat protein
MSGLEQKIEELWDQGEAQAFSQFEDEITSLTNDHDVLGCVLLARFYYRYSLLYDEKANTARQFWVEGDRYAEDKKAWNKGGELINKALDLIKKAYALSPDSPQVLPYYSLILYRTIRHCTMITALPHMKALLEINKKTLEKGPDDPTAVLAFAIKELGRSPKMGGNPRNAIHYFRKVLELDAHHAEGHFWFGRFYMHPDIKPQPKLAMPYFEKATALNPHNWLYRENLEAFKKAFPLG